MYFLFEPILNLLIPESFLLFIKMLQVEKKILNNLWDDPLREILFLLSSVSESRKTEVILILIIHCNAAFLFVTV